MPPTIDHVGITAPEEHFDSLIEWYKKALSPLQYRELMRFPGAVGLGNETPDFWITQKETSLPSGVHIAFSAPDRASVDAFHQAAIAAGGTCNGPPGIRAEYHPNYYGAFILDPIGTNVEMVVHT